MDLSNCRISILFSLENYFHVNKEMNKKYNKKSAKKLKNAINCKCQYILFFVPSIVSIAYTSAIGYLILSCSYYSPKFTILSEGT